MFQPNFDGQPSHDPSARFNKLAFVVGDPKETLSEGNEPRLLTGDEEVRWVNERLTACYND